VLLTVAPPERLRASGSRPARLRAVS
jgi:hypothetical protein